MFQVWKTNYIVPKLAKQGSVKISAKTGLSEQPLAITEAR